MPRGQISELKRINTDKKITFYTENDIKFVWPKKEWSKSKVGCYGCLTHEDCWDELKKNLGIQVTFEDIYKHVGNNNLLEKIEYTDSLEKTWTHFILYKKASLKRKQSCERFKRMRIRDTNRCVRSVRKVST
jgi:hypothetical protein